MSGRWRKQNLFVSLGHQWWWSSGSWNDDRNLDDHSGSSSFGWLAHGSRMDPRSSRSAVPTAFDHRVRTLRSICSEWPFEGLKKGPELMRLGSQNRDALGSKRSFVERVLVGFCSTKLL